jgi:hypothetical protein
MSVFNDFDLLGACDADFHAMAAMYGMTLSIQPKKRAAQLAQLLDMMQETRTPMPNSEHDPTLARQERSEARRTGAG